MQPSCKQDPPKYPLKKKIGTKLGELRGWHGTKETTVLDDVFPDTCDCEFHTYKAVVRVRYKGKKGNGNLVDPHVRFHRGGKG